MQNTPFLKKLIFFSVCLCVLPASASVLIDTTGYSAFVNNDFRVVQKILDQQSPVKDSLYWHFKQGIAHSGVNEFEKALDHLKRCDNITFPLRGVALECIGDVNAKLSRIPDAIHAYLLARRDSTMTALCSEIDEKLLAIVKEQPSLIAAYPELAAISAEHHVLEQQGAVSDSLSHKIDSLLAKPDVQPLDSLLIKDIDSLPQSRKAAIAESLFDKKRIDTLLSAKILFQFSKALLAAKKSAYADSMLKRCETRRDFKTAVDNKQYLFQKAFAAYGCARYAEAIRYFVAYEKNAEPNPDVVLNLGRAYRATGNDSAAEKTYRRFAALFPANSMTPDVLWYIAWEYEETGNYPKAIDWYQRIAALRRSRRSDDAQFRAGLCLYKSGNYKRAGQVFCTVTDESSYYSGALYWKAKSLQALGKSSEAVDIFNKVIHDAPMEFYAFRAREMLILSGNARTVSCIDTTANDSLTRQWIDSLSSKKSLSVYDSLALLRAALLAFCGQSEQSQLFLNTIDTKSSGNLGLLYDLSMLYRQTDNVALSNRLARKIAMRIPVNQRAVMPQTFFDLLYPKPYFDIVTREAGRNNIDPFIVLAVMRQESVYDPSIVSHAGAIGLMQMMPATGKTVSRAFKESFAADSLYKPYVNIKFGTYYIKQLLEQFHGNLVLAIASYNGGPAKAAEWFEKNKKKTFDLFIEDIGFTETRGYVKKVLANYWIYRGYVSHILQSKW